MGYPENTDPRLLGKRLSEARKARGVTQDQAAAHLGCSRPTLIAIEKGTRPAKPDEIIRLASFYRRSVHDLVRAGAQFDPIEPHLRAAIDLTQPASEELSQAIAELERFAEDYRTLEDLLDAKLSLAYPAMVSLHPHIGVRELAEDVAMRERTRLNLADRPARDLRQVLESGSGVRIFAAPMPSGIAGMYAFVPELGYCILTNIKHPHDRQRWTLAHEYGHFLCDRHKPGIDYLQAQSRRSLSEQFVDAFAKSFLMPASGIRRAFVDITTTTRDFQVADLCRLSVEYDVSTQAMTLRLEELGLIDRGSWNMMKEKGFKPEAAKREIAGGEPGIQSDEPYPLRYKRLAVQAFINEKISEGELARFLRCDRVTAREIVADLVEREHLGWSLLHTAS